LRRVKECVTEVRKYESLFSDLYYTLRDSDVPIVAELEVMAKSLDQFVDALNGGSDKPYFTGLYLSGVIGRAISAVASAFEYRRREQTLAIDGAG
jgi:hypothetical protein